MKRVTLVITLLYTDDSSFCYNFMKRRPKFSHLFSPTHRVVNLQ